MARGSMLIVTPFQVTDVGGVSAAVTALAGEFTVRGYAVDVLVPGESNRVQPRGQVAGANVHELYLRSPIVPGRVLRGLVGFVARFVPTLRALRAFTRTRQTRVVLVQYPLPGAFYFGVLRLLSSWRLIVTYQGNDAHDLHGWSWLDRRLVGVLVRAADSVVAVSRSLLDKVIREFPDIPQEKRRVIPNGAPVERLAGGNGAALPQVPERFVLAVGHLIYRKGMDIIIRALQLTNRSLDLVVAGGGPDHDELVRLARSTGLEDRVHFVGSQPPEVTLQLFRRCEFFVLGSRAEGLPLVVVEAMACGKAVVATRIDGVPEIVQHEHTGMLVEPENPASMADAIVRLYDDPGLTERLGLNARERVLQGFSWSAVAGRYEELFEGAGSGATGVPSVVPHSLSM